MPEMKHEERRTHYTSPLQDVIISKKLSHFLRRLLCSIVTSEGGKGMSAHTK